MSRPNPEKVAAAIEELANALQGVVGLTAMLRQQVKTTAEYAFAVDGAIARIVTALRRLHPLLGPGGGEQ